MTHRKTAEENNHLLLQINRKLNHIVADSMDDQLIWLYHEGFDIAIKVKHILYCEYQSTPKERTCIFFIDEATGTIKCIHSSCGIGKWEKTLSRFRFCRIHRGLIVNYKQLTKFSRAENMVTMKAADKSFPVSKTGKEKLLLLMQQHFM